MEIQKLKPDLNREDLVVKRVNAERVKEFAKNLQDYNKQVLKQQRKLPPSSEASSIEASAKVLESKRAKALEFARHIPKPKVQPSTKNIGVANVSKGRHIPEDEAYIIANDEFGGTYETAGKLLSLEQKHEESRLQVDAIKRSMGLLK